MKTCGDCIHADVCERIPFNTEFSRDNPAYCNDFKDSSMLAEFPCKVGDTVWFVGTSNINRLKLGVIETTVEKLVLKAGGIYIKLSCNAMYETSSKAIGKTVFFNREDAEQKLAERMNK